MTSLVQSPVSWLRPVLLAVACPFVLVLGSLRAEDDNPFARPGDVVGGPVEPSGPASPLDAIELRGVMTLGETTIVTLFDSSSSRSTVVSLGGTVNGITASDYQQSDDSVLVSSGGLSRRVRIKKAQIAVYATPAPAPIPIASSTGLPQPPSAPPNADEDTKARMDRVAEEIRRRRVMRREMMERAQQQQQQQQPAPAQQ